MPPELPGTPRARRYRRVPAELVAALRRFQGEHPARVAQLGDTRWTYLDSGTGASVVFLLTGAIGRAEVSWRTIDHLAARHRVIAPDYPAIDTMSGLVDGLAGLLDLLAIERAQVVGGSYGGLVAQAFIRRHPGRAGSLVLSHTRLPDAASTAQMSKALRWLENLPRSVLSTLLRLRLAKLYPARGAPEIRLSKAHAGELSSQLTKAQLLAMMRRLVDLGLSFRFTPGDLAEWSGRILLAMAEDDPATPEAARQALIAMYPRAEVKLFSGGGHLTALLQKEEYFAALDAFLERSAA